MEYILLKYCSVVEIYLCGLYHEYTPVTKCLMVALSEGLEDERIRAPGATRRSYKMNLPSGGFPNPCLDQRATNVPIKY